MKLQLHYIFLCVFTGIFNEVTPKNANGSFRESLIIHEVWRKTAEVTVFFMILCG